MAGWSDEHSVESLVGWLDARQDPNLAVSWAESSVGLSDEQQAVHWAANSVAQRVDLMEQNLVGQLDEK